jgi:acetyltransferase-like isoleucine patch superfamily enzyme
MGTKVIVTKLEPYEDERGNRIVYGGSIEKNIGITFAGSNNTLVVSDDARLGKFVVQFDCSNGYFEIGASRLGQFSTFSRVGEDSKIVVGNDVSTTGLCVISAVEGTEVTIGNDSMLAMENEIRADDGHPIFDVSTGKRVNPAKSITLGDHVWLAKRAVVLGGASMGSGSVLGFGSILTGSVPNNSVAAGVPARVIRKNVAWERPHLSVQPPPYKPDSSVIQTTDYWAMTQE